MRTVQCVIACMRAVHIIITPIEQPQLSYLCELGTESTDIKNYLLVSSVSSKCVHVCRVVNLSVLWPRAVVHTCYAHREAVHPAYLIDNLYIKRRVGRSCAQHKRKKPQQEQRTNLLRRAAGSSGQKSYSQDAANSPTHLLRT